MDGKMDGWTDGRTAGWPASRLGGRKPGWTNGRADGWTGGQADRWIGAGRWARRWEGERAGGQKDRQEGKQGMHTHTRGFRGHPAEKGRTPASCSHWRTPPPLRTPPLERKGRRQAPQQPASLLFRSGQTPEICVAGIVRYCGIQRASQIAETLKR